MKFPDQNR